MVLVGSGREGGMQMEVGGASLGAGQRDAALVKVAVPQQWYNE